MQIATILPTAYLHLIKNDDYHMALAHLIGVDEKYTDFYRECGEEGKYVILDNSIIEDAQCDIDELIDKAIEINCSEIILPDVFMDKEATLDLSYKALLHYQELQKKYELHFKLMAVPQGKNLQEWLECAVAMIDWDIQVIGIPKVLVSLAGSQGRLQAIEQLGNKLRGLEIHLLGCWETPLELIAIKKAFKDKVRGVDSAIAYVYALNNLHILEAERPKGKIDFNEANTDIELLQQNINVWRDCCDELDPKVSRLSI